MQNFWTLNNFVKTAVSQKIWQTKLFGVELQQNVEDQKAHFTFLHVPWLIRLCVDDILRRGKHLFNLVQPLGIALEGIFRVPGRQEIINAICEAFESG